MSQDYRLKNAYDAVRTNSITSSNYTTLKTVYEANAAAARSFATQQKPSTNYLTEDYNELIKRALKKTAIPTPVGNYRLVQKSVDFVIDNQDLAIFQQLYKIAPPTKGSKDTGAGSRGSGNGEIALYWLLGKHIKIQDNRGAKDPDAPDLKIGEDVGVEVKSYKNLNSIKIGKFKNDKENRNLLAILLGVDVLFSDNPFSTIKNLSKKDRPVTVDVFNSSEIEKAFEVFLKIFNWLNPMMTSTPVSFLQQFYNQMVFLLKSLGVKSQNAGILTGQLLKKFAKTKFTKKPGFGGYIANIVPGSNHIEIVYVDASKFEKEKPEFFKNNVESASGEIQISNLKQMFS